jgi:hypothetical protein
MSRMKALGDVFHNAWQIKTDLAWIRLILRPHKDHTRTAIRKSDATCTKFKLLTQL